MRKQLQWIGGILVNPRDTLRALTFEGPVRVSVLLLMLLAMVVVTEPLGTGRALLVGQVRILDGISLFVMTLMGRALEPMLVSMGAALVLYILVRRRPIPGQSIGYDSLSDVAMYLLVPYILMAVLGVFVSASGLDLVEYWPVHGVRGRGLTFWIQLLIAYGWSLVLFVCLAGLLWKAGAPSVTERS